MKYQALLNPKKEMSSALENQVGGNHYKDMVIQPIEFAMKNNFNACQSSILKYICRYKRKNGIEDLQKAKHYIDLLIEFEKKEEYKQTLKDVIKQ